MLICKKCGYFVYEEFQLREFYFIKKAWEILEISIYNFKLILPVYLIISNIIKNRNCHSLKAIPLLYMGIGNKMLCYVITLQPLTIPAYRNYSGRCTHDSLYLGIFWI